MLRDHRSHATGATQRRGHDGQVKQGEQEGLHARDSVGQTSGATQRGLNPGCSQRIGNSRRTGVAGSWRSRWRDPSTAAGRPAGRSGGAARQRSPPMSTTPPHRRVERGRGYRPASSQRVLRLIRGMDLRLHLCGVAPAEDHEKCGPRRPTRRGSSCNNASIRCQNTGEGQRFRASH